MGARARHLCHLAAVAWHPSGGGTALCPPPYGGRVFVENGGRVVVENAATTGGATLGRPAGLPSQRGGNCEPGAGGARLAVGGFFPDQPMTAQLMSTPTEPYGSG
jgi:hypothetical protein